MSASVSNASVILAAGFNAPGGAGMAASGQKGEAATGFEALLGAMLGEVQPEAGVTAPTLPAPQAAQPTDAALAETEARPKAGGPTADAEAPAQDAAAVDPASSMLLGLMIVPQVAPQAATPSAETADAPAAAPQVPPAAAQAFQAAQAAATTPPGTARTNAEPVAAEGAFADMAVPDAEAPTAARPASARTDTSRGEAPTGRPAAATAQAQPAAAAAPASAPVANPAEGTLAAAPAIAEAQAAVMSAPTAQVAQAAAKPVDKAAPTAKDEPKPAAASEAEPSADAAQPRKAATNGAQPPGAAAKPATDPAGREIAAAESKTKTVEVAADTDTTPDAQPQAATVQASSISSSHATAATPVRGGPETVAHLAGQIVKKLDGRSTRFDVALDPIGLGHVDVRVEINSRGHVSAAMSFENPQAAAELRSRASELQKALEQAGFDLSGGLTFDLASDQGRQNGRGLQQDDPGAAFRGRAFQAAMNTGEAADAAATATIAYSRRASTGVDVRI